MIQATTVSEEQPDGTLNIITDGVDPFEFVTIASVCMGIFKTLFLAQRVKVEITRDQETSWHEIEAFEGVNGVRLDGNWVSLVDLEKDEFTNVGKRQLISPIAVVPSQGYTSKENFSIISIQWLEWRMFHSQQRGRPVHIRHALNGGKYRIPGTNYRCDGFVENAEGKGTIYEFYGKTFLLCITAFGI